MIFYGKLTKMIKLSSIKRKITLIILIIGAFLIWIFQNGLYQQEEIPKLEQKIDLSVNDSKDEKPKIISTNPDPLNNSIIIPSQVITLTFNHPLENIGEFKYRIEPEPPEIKVELTLNRRTVKITPVKPFLPGTSYTIFIQSYDTKFDGGKRLENDLSYNFRTIEYRGI